MTVNLRKKDWRGEFVTVDAKGRIENTVGMIYKRGDAFVIVEPKPYGRPGEILWMSAEFKKTDFRRVGTLNLGYASIPQYTAK